MPAYAIETRAQILQRMANRVVARSSLSDLNSTSGWFNVLAAVARAMERAQQGELDLISDTDLDQATGEALAEVGKIYNVTKGTALFATSTVIFTRTGNVGTITIATGTQPRAPESLAGEDLDFATTAVGTILNGATQSAAVAIKAAAAGAKYNVYPNTITSFVSKPSGVDAVYNPNRVTNGRDEQTDDEYRESIRAKIKSLSRSTVLGLQGGAQSAEDVASGKTAVWVAVFEDEFWHVYDPTEPQATIYVDDGNGTAESTIARVGQAVLTAVGGEVDIYLPESPIKPSSTFSLYVNAILVNDTNYWFNPQSGHVKLKAAAYPSGLTVADAVTADYTAFTGLLALVQKIIDGDPLDRSTYPGFRAAGVRISVLAPTIASLIVTADVTVLKNYDQTTVLAAVVAAIQGYVNNLSIGEDLIRSELIERIMGVVGVYNVKLTAPASDVVITERQLARASASQITVT